MDCPDSSGAYLVGTMMTVIAHPFSYVKALVQLGYEPLTPIISKDMFNQRRLVYPGIFKYFDFIVQQEGTVGLFRGVSPRILTYSTMALVYNQSKKIVLTHKEIEGAMNPHTIAPVLSYLIKESFCRCAGVVFSHPFYVGSIRVMALFGGLSNSEELANAMGGVVPRLVLELCTLWLSELTTYFINTKIIDDQSELSDLRGYVPIVTSYAARSVCYPLSVVSTVMVSNNMFNHVGQPVTLPQNFSWTQCLKMLFDQGIAYRGFNLFLRPAILPRKLDSLSRLSQAVPKEDS